MKKKILQNGIFLVLAIMFAAVAVQAQTTAFETAKLLASDGATNDHFGMVSISGDTAIVGASDDDDHGSRSGAAYIFVRNENGDWNEQAKLTASDAAAQLIFGWSVSISGNTAIVGAVYGNRYRGAAYVFVRNENGDWNEQAKLTASDDDGVIGDWFGNRVSIVGEVAIIGSNFDDANGYDSGSAYIFVRNAGVWTEQAKLIASDAGAYDEFGWSVSISGNTAIVGAFRNDDSGTDSGSAYIFVRDGTTWTEQAKLTDSDAAAGDWFGYSVSISGDTAFVGAPIAGDNDTQSGSAYIFVRDMGGTDNWDQAQKLTTSDGAPGDWFGHSISISGDTAVLSAPLDDDNGEGSGSAYIFRRDESVWTEQAKLIASDGAPGDLFGWGYRTSVSISGDTVIVGAYLNDNVNGIDAGSAYVFELSSYLLIADIEDLVEQGALASSHGNALTNKLNLAIKQLEKGNTSAALGKLNAVIEQTQDFIADGHISTEDGQAIIDAVQEIIDSISG